MYLRNRCASIEGLGDEWLAALGLVGIAGAQLMATAKKMAHVVQDEEALADVTKRLRRAEGQIGGILRMLDEGRSCEDVVMQLAAVSKAIDKAAFSLITAGLRECITEGKNNADDVAQQLQRLFLTMA